MFNADWVSQYQGFILNQVIWVLLRNWGQVVEKTLVHLSSEGELVEGDIGVQEVELSCKAIGLCQIQTGFAKLIHFLSEDLLYAFWLGKRAEFSVVFQKSQQTSPSPLRYAQHSQI